MKFCPYLYVVNSKKASVISMRKLNKDNSFWHYHIILQIIYWSMTFGLLDRYHGIMSLRLKSQFSSIFWNELNPVFFDVWHFEKLENEIVSCLGNSFGNFIVMNQKFNQSLEIFFRFWGVNRDVVNPFL